MISLSIKGMASDNCAKHIKGKLESMAGVSEADVSFSRGNAFVHANRNVKQQKVCDEISKLGYTTDKILHVAIIGSGSGAFACAIKAAEGGARVTMIESAAVIGGCCVNVGCVPSKILIRAAHLAQQQRSNPFLGLKNHPPLINRHLLAEQQSNCVEALRLAKYENILESNPALNLIKGHASFVDPTTLKVTLSDGGEHLICADKYLIATGSTAIIPEIDGLSKSPYWTSTEALFATEMTSHLLVIGSSVVALEIAQAYRRLGADVTILARHTLLYNEDPLLGDTLQKSLEKEGICVLTNTSASKVEYDGKKYKLMTNQGYVTGDRLLVSTGRRANTASLNLSTAGVNVDTSGAIQVNQKMESTAANIYATGDCTSLPQYVYVAAAGGARAGSNMTGSDVKLDLSTMPAVIFTDPQVATVGLTEKDAIAQGIKIESRVLEMSNVPRAIANFETDGFIKLVAEAVSGRLIGAQILAHEGGEIIQSAALSIRNQMTIDEIASQLFPYLTMVESLKLCAQTFSKDVNELSCCAA